MKTTIVIDTNVLIGALIGKQYSANRKLVELCFTEQFQPLINNILFTEYEDVMSRPEIVSKSTYTSQEINDLFDAFLSICQSIKMYYLSQSSFKHENDNYLIELAVAGNAEIIFTHNIKYFKQAQIKFPQIQIKQPQEIL